jgi:hypothetical protein
VVGLFKTLVIVFFDFGKCLLVAQFLVVELVGGFFETECDESKGEGDADTHKFV